MALPPLLSLWPFRDVIELYGLPGHAAVGVRARARAGGCVCVCACVRVCVRLRMTQKHFARVGLMCGIIQLRHTT